MKFKPSNPAEPSRKSNIIGSILSFIFGCFALYALYFIAGHMDKPWFGSSNAGASSPALTGKTAASKAYPHYVADKFFIADYPCTPVRTITNSKVNPDPRNVSQYDSTQSADYSCGDISVSVDTFPAEYGDQQMSDILHEVVDTEVISTNADANGEAKVKDFSKTHDKYKSFDAFFVDYNDLRPNQFSDSPKPIHHAVYFRKGQLIYSLVSESDTDQLDFFKSFTVTR